MMNRFDGMSYAQIARTVGLSETVVRKHVAKALVDCQKALQTQMDQGVKWANLLSSHQTRSISRRQSGLRLCSQREYPQKIARD